MNKILKLRGPGSTPMPWHGWVLGGILLLFGLASSFDYLMSVTQGEAYFRSSGMTNAQISYYSNFPAWATMGWTMSVWGGLLASATMLLHYRQSLGLFMVSLAGHLLFILYSYFFSAGREAMGVLWTMPIIVALITIGMIFYCRYLTKSKVLI
jgi:hypothetical protein